MKHLIACSLLILFAACATPPKPAAAPETDAGVYMIVMGTVTNREAFMRGYAAKLPPLYEKFGGAYVALSGDLTVLEGTPGFESLVISKWPSRAAAEAFWNSPEYRFLADQRIQNRWGDFKVVLIPALPAPVQRSPSLE
jgi:uncharacterized protein (DUF1330 family)